MSNNNCKIIEKKIERFQMRLFEEEIDETQFLCFLHDLSYEQLFVMLVKEKLDEMGLKQK